MKITPAFGYLNNESGELYLEGCSQDIILEIIDRLNKTPGPTYGIGSSDGSAQCYGYGWGAYRTHFSSDGNGSGSGNSCGRYDGVGGAM